MSKKKKRIKKDLTVILEDKMESIERETPDFNIDLKNDQHFLGKTVKKKR